jgi:hypothetical protein
MILISVWLALIIGRAIIDYKLISKNKTIDHTENAIVTCTTAAILCIIAKSITLFPILLNIHWLIFDVVLNYLRNLPLQYLGRSAWTDRVLKVYSKGHVILFKTVLLVIFVTIYKITNI